VRELLAESPVSSDRNLWLVVPDAWPDGLRVVWLVLGKTPDDFHSVTIPIEAGQMPVVAEALSRRNPVAERCDTCRLWRRLTDASGECHALAPAPVLYDPGALFAGLPAAGIRVAWPVTLSGEMCGEWSPLPVRPQDGGQTP
jgi:hypothetical protein